jgi:(2Fe-2S) ferredoxin
MATPFRLHVIACDGSSCRDRGSRDVLRTLRARLAEKGLVGEIRLSVCSCLGLCTRGPNCVVYPDAVWYSGLSPRRVERIVDEHLEAGRPVESLALDWDDVEEPDSFRLT